MTDLQNHYSEVLNAPITRRMHLETAQAMFWHILYWSKAGAAQDNPTVFKKPKSCEKNSLCFEIALLIALQALQYFSPC